jgi:Flp pilus assembly protein CpaB
VTSYKRHVQRGEDHVTVLVAKKDISEGMTGAEAAGLLTPLQVPRRSVVPGAISNADQITGLVATQPTLEGEQVTTRRFSPVSENGVRADLKGTLRAMQVHGDANQTLAGTLRDGDHVDVVATFKYPDGCTVCVHITRVVLHNLKVLNAPDVPAASGKLTNGLQNDYAVMLLVTDRQAQRLSFTEVVADNDGGWALTLRPVVHANDSPESVSALNGKKGIAHDGLSNGVFDAATGGH